MLIELIEQCVCMWCTNRATVFHAARHECNGCNPREYGYVGCMWACTSCRDTVNSTWSYRCFWCSKNVQENMWRVQQEQGSLRGDEAISSSRGYEWTPR